jgi:hypothetical protein
MIKNRKALKIREKQIGQIYIVGFFLLALGDTGHVGFRVIAYIAGGLEPNSLLVGLGALSTAITITFLYILILEAWRLTFDKSRDALYFFLILMGIIRLIIFVFPQNEWGNVIPPYAWSIARNVPLMIQGVVVGVLLALEGKKNQNSLAKKLAICIFLSYGFYIPVIFLIQIFPLVGMLMIPKTVAYMAIVWFVYEEYFTHSGQE